MATIIERIIKKLALCLRLRNSIFMHCLGLILFLSHNVAQSAMVSPEIKVENNKADLTLLINETLAINNKTFQENVDKSVLKDDWTFDMVEYDLMDFLQDLGARYQLANKTKITDESGLEDSKSLQSKKQELGPSAADTQNSTEAVQQVTSTIKPATIDQSQNATTESQKSGYTSTPRSPVSHPTEVPQLSTSIASGDHEIAESSWQYGIFDRFTRPKSTSTTAAPELPVKLDENGRLDMRNFNHEECGLRTYDDRPQLFPEQLESDSADAIKDLSQRRQRLPALPPIARRKQQNVDVSSLASDSEFDKQAFNSEGDPYDESFSPATESGAHDDSEFNLAHRRNWMQQQLGNTLQILGFNTTGHQSLDEYLNDTLLTARRENMMKMSSKLGKSADLEAAPSISQPSSGDSNLINGEKLAGRQDELKLEARVIGGSDARLGDSPWSVSLQALVARPGTGGIEYRHYCGGTIISEYYVLTAAHCLDFMVGRESRMFVVVGDLNWRMSTASLYGRRFGIEKLIIHSGYKSTAFGHDIGLIKVKESMRPLKVNGRYIVNSVCLPEKNVEHTGEAELVGWGLFSNRNEMADSLQIAEVPILPRPLCVDLYRRRTGLIQWLIGIELITEKQVCAGTFGRGICQGDSGSALVYNQKISRRDGKQRHKLRAGNNDETKATIIGVVAFGGIRRCSYQSLPGVYMQASKYMDWIVPRIQA